MSVINVMDRTDDTRHEWDVNNPEEVNLARRIFDAAKEKRYLAYKIDDRGERTLIREFEPRAGRIVMTPQNVGG